MEHERRSDDQQQLEDHSLPGTNQAGKGPGPCETPDDDPRLESRTVDHPKTIRCPHCGRDVDLPRDEPW